MFRYRLRTLLRVAGYSVLGLAGVPAGFLGIGMLANGMYVMARVYRAFQKLPPHEPGLFALAVAGSAAFVMLGVLALVQEHWTSRSLLVLWCGAIVGVAFYGVAVILKLQGIL